jgi:hypothetical protein
MALWNRRSGPPLAFYQRDLDLIGWNGRSTSFEVLNNGGRERKILCFGAGQLTPSEKKGRLLYPASENDRLDRKWRARSEARLDQDSDQSGLVHGLVGPSSRPVCSGLNRAWNRTQTGQWLAAFDTSPRAG